MRIKQLISFFMMPFPRETFYSIVARASHYLGYPTDAKAITRIVGDRSHQLHADLPSVCSTATDVFGLERDKAIDTTLFSYYEPWLSNERSQLIKQSMLLGTKRIPHAMAGISASRISLDRPLRYCPLCALEDYDIYGTTFWHVDHQAPGVWACELHHVQLESIAPRRSAMEIPPTGHPSYSARYASHRDVQLARLSSDMMRLQCGGSINAAIAADIYRSKLIRKDLITECGQVRQRELKSKLLRFWESLTVYGTVERMINSGNDLSYPSSIFYRRPSHYLPIKHLLIIGFLFNEWSDFLVSYINFRADGCRADQLGSNPDNQHTDDDEQSVIDKAIPLLKKGNSIRKASKLSGLSFVKTKALATGMGVNVKLRPQLLFEDKRRAIWRKLHIGESTDAISTSCSVSLGLVEQELTAHQYLIPLRKKIRFYKKLCHHKKMIIDYMKEHPNCSRNDIRTALGSAYLWLYKNNSHFLYSLIPAEVPRQLRRSKSQST